MIAEIQKLLWATTRLRSQLEFQGEADACLKVPHLDEYDSKKAGGGGGGERGGRGGRCYGGKAGKKFAAG